MEYKKVILREHKSCVNTRGIPAAAQQVLPLQLCILGRGYPSTPGPMGGTPIIKLGQYFLTLQEKWQYFLFFTQGAEVQIWAISGPTKRTHVLQNVFKKKFFHTLQGMRGSYWFVNSSIMVLCEKNVVSNC